MSSSGTRRLGFVLFIVSAVVFAKEAVAQTCVPPPTDRVSWWRAEGDATDSADGNDGAMPNGGSFETGQVGLAYRDPTPTDFLTGGIHVPDSQNLTLSTLTIEAWIRIDAQTPGLNQSIFWKGNLLGQNKTCPYSLGITDLSFNVNPGAPVHGTLAQGKLFFQVANGNIEEVFFSDAIPTIGSFVHVAATLSSTEACIYINGQPDVTYQEQIRPYDSPYDLGIATRFSGLVDEVALYNRALTATEVQSIYEAGSLGECVGSVAGRVAASCPAPDTGIAGVSVAAYAPGAPGSTGSAFTDGSGAYSIQNLPGGMYLIRIVTPSGYSAATTEEEVLIVRNGESTVDFALTCLPGSVSGHILADCPAPNTPLNQVGVEVYRAGSEILLRSEASDPSGLYTVAGLDPGNYSVRLLVPPGHSIGNPSVNVSVVSEQTSTADFALHCLPQGPGSIAGLVVADCPQPGTGLHGVTVDVFSVGTGALNATATTDAAGNYALADLEPGDYTVSVIRPLGTIAAEDELQITVAPAQESRADFFLSCAQIESNPQAPSYWKHQVAVALHGHGHAEVDASTLCGYLDLIAGHFNSNQINAVEVYQPPVSGACADKLVEAKAILNLRGSETWRARARKQLLSLLLNVAAGRVSQTAVVSMDGATLSQAITHCDNIIDDPMGDHQRARNIARRINNDDPVPSGWIPLDTETISYRLPVEILVDVGPFRSSPNPGSGERNFLFRLENSGPVTLEVFNAAGRLVATPFTGALGVGSHLIAWDGRGLVGEKVVGGIYFARLSTPGSQTSKTIKLVLVNGVSVQE